MIPAAGLGTRLLPVTKEHPKEMLPLFARGSDGNLCVKPLLQAVFEQLYDFGFREFCFIVGRGKRAIEDHFTPDSSTLSMLKGRGKNNAASDLECFYRRLYDSTLIWVNQPEPLGFGNAVFVSRSFVGDESFLVHAGDTLIISEGTRCLERLTKTNDRFGADAVFAVKEVEDPRQFGVIRCVDVEPGVFRVVEAVEKPERPPTRLAIMPVYIFTPAIFEALGSVGPGRGGEVQLTDGIQRMVADGFRVFAVRLEDDELWLDVGTPGLYWEALHQSHSLTCKGV